jgi:Predicted esterase
LYTALRYPETLLGILAISTYLPAPERVESTAHPANKQAPIFLAHGRHDEMINIRHAYRSKETLECLTNPLEWHEYDMGHEVCPEEIADIGRWLSGRFEADQDKQP